MSICNLKNGTLFIGESATSIDELFNQNFYKYSNTIADLYSTGEVYDNVLFYNMIQKILAFEFYLKSNGVDELIIEDSTKPLCNYAADAGNKLGIRVLSKTNTNTSKSVIIGELKMFGAALYLLRRQFTENYASRDVDFEKDFAVLRTTAAKGKIKANESRELFLEDTIGKGNFYRFFKFRRRFNCLIKGWKDAKKTLRSLIRNMENWEFHSTLRYTVNFFAHRLVAVKFYQNLIGELFNLPWKGKFISGNNLDMYAIAEEIEAKKRGIQTICIPHGIEYGFKFPHCFTGDSFFTLSKKAAVHLNEMYCTNKFMFDEDIVAQIFRLPDRNVSKDHRVIYFSDPAEPEVNVKIIDGLLAAFEKTDIPLYIKNHPNDNLSIYSKYGSRLRTIDNLKDAVCNNICLARKSTTLLEGVYNDSWCAAVIINEKDKSIFYSFPSLQDDNISVFYSIEEAASWAMNLYERLQQSADNQVDG